MVNDVVEQIGDYHAVLSDPAGVYIKIFGRGLINYYYSGDSDSDVVSRAYMSNHEYLFIKLQLRDHKLVVR